VIKLLGVTGNKLMETDSHVLTQDFIMISHPIFLANMATRCVAMLAISQSRELQTAMIPLVVVGKERRTSAATLYQLGVGYCQEYLSLFFVTFYLQGRAPLPVVSILAPHKAGWTESQLC
jgi:hypothetical protein